MIMDDTRTTLERIAACYAGQHPEAFGRPAVNIPYVDGIGAREAVSASMEVIAEDPMGNPDAVQSHDTEILVP